MKKLTKEEYIVLKAEKELGNKMTKEELESIYLFEYERSEEFLKSNDAFVSGLGEVSVSNREVSQSINKTYQSLDKSYQDIQENQNKGLSDIYYLNLAFYAVLVCAFVANKLLSFEWETKTFGGE